MRNEATRTTHGVVLQTQLLLPGDTWDSRDMDRNAPGVGTGQRRTTPIFLDRVNAYLFSSMVLASRSHCRMRTAVPKSLNDW